MWTTHYIELHPARVYALVVCIGVVLGGSLAELGDLSAYYVFHIGTYYFDKYFLALGVLGLIVSGFALCRR